MSQLAVGSTILVTGTTGYIAAHITDQLLQKGYKVKGTARDPESKKSKHLKDLFAVYQGNFEIVKAGDLEEDNVFDHAVKGVDAIIHVASPFHFKAQDAYKDLINPAVHGTESILSSAHKYGDKVKQVVITSSVAAIYGPPKGEGYTYTEEDWNDKAVEDIEKDPNNFVQATAYRASKNAAERAAWKFVEEKKPSFTLTTINPCFVFGPVIHYIENVQSINTSVELLFKYFKSPSQIGLPGPTQSYVDVRDVAEMHIVALERPEAAGQRFISCAGGFTWQQVVDILKEEYPDRKSAEGGEGAGVKEIQYQTDNTKSKQVLGTKYIPLKKCVVDTIESLRKFW